MARRPAASSCQRPASAAVGVRSQSWKSGTCLPSLISRDHAEAVAELILGHRGRRGRSGVIIGTAGDDVIVGSPGPDIIRAGAGNDIVCGRGGDDIIYGGTGNDTLLGEGGDDELHGGLGFDRLVGGPGDDSLFGDGQNDRLLGGPGRRDVCNGGPPAGRSGDSAVRCEVTIACRSKPARCVATSRDMTGSPSSIQSAGDAAIMHA
ncbi:MAG: hypothetical protein GEU28_10865 [Dehalococcoidia bacterium]|nr:hypothetical protein [Dehalococcoidia bacterium]